MFNWFKRKPTNRRFTREHVLDVKLRSDKARSARTRVIALSLGVVFTLVAAAFILFKGSQWALNEMVYSNPAFQIRQLDVQTDGIIMPEQLVRWSGVRIGENLMELDLTRVKRELELNPAIQAVSVERILPGTLRVRVSEREPTAQVNVPRPRQGGGIEIGVFHLDPDGFVMLPLEPRYCSVPPAQAGDQTLPIIYGLNPNDLQAGKRVQTPQLRAALSLIEAFVESPMAGLVDIKRIDIASPEVLTATTGQGSEITFGLSGIDQQLRRWREIFELGQRNNKAIATLDLAVSNNIPARWLEASTVPAVTPKLPKPSRNKKKHV